MFRPQGRGGPPSGCWFTRVKLLLRWWVNPRKYVLVTRVAEVRDVVATLQSANIMRTIDDIGEVVTRIHIYSRHDVIPKSYTVRPRGGRRSRYESETYFYFFFLNPFEISVFHLSTTTAYVPKSSHPKGLRRLYRPWCAAHIFTTISVRTSLYGETYFYRSLKIGFVSEIVVL